ncbi:MAG: NADH-quinone oxidoreductase subunit M, partial [Elusimicrobia bacterium]|nr:NADH-quinone oxidoreductase subunit M [Elusimicrobiota bacterium]MBD3412318.1 NADH-quinone oxidoreductase subunit M [Elusimicrobiota bacterium]
IMLTAGIFFLLFFSSLSVTVRIKEYFFFYLILETSLLGIFVSLNCFLFYFFWGLTLIPAYCMIGIWGSENRESAALNYFINFALGSILILIGFIALYFSAEPKTLTISSLIEHGPSISMLRGTVVFWLLTIGFLMCIPAVPFHFWMTPTQVSAITPVSVILAALYMKAGLYGMFRIVFPLLPVQARQFAPIILIIGIVNVLYGVFVTFAHKDVKRMVTYSSLIHVGLCLIGLGSLSMNGFIGSAAHLFIHGLVIALLLILVNILHQRTNTYALSQLGGLASVMPTLTGFMAVAVCSVIGLPGFASFMSQFMIFLGVYEHNPMIAMISVGVLIILAGIFIRMLERIFLGKSHSGLQHVRDLTRSEIMISLPLIVLLIFLGWYPVPVFDMLTDSMTVMLGIIK